VSETQSVSSRPLTDEHKEALGLLYAVWKLIWVEDAPHVVDGPKRLDGFAVSLDERYGFGAKFQAEEDAQHGS
jgi:hypothetical protein